VLRGSDREKVAAPVPIISLALVTLNSAAAVLRNGRPVIIASAAMSAGSALTRWWSRVAWQHSTTSTNFPCASAQAAQANVHEVLLDASGPSIPRRHSRPLRHVAPAWRVLG
jgi:hypothetical protein